MEPELSLSGGGMIDFVPEHLEVVVVTDLVTVMAVVSAESAAALAKILSAMSVVLASLAIDMHQGSGGMIGDT